MSGPTLRSKPVRARDTREGDLIVFHNPRFNYIAEMVDTDPLGNVRHRYNDDTASTSYDPREWLWVEKGIAP